MQQTPRAKAGECALACQAFSGILLLLETLPAITGWSSVSAEWSPYYLLHTQRLPPPLIHLPRSNVQPLQPQTPHQLPPVIRLTYSTSYSRYIEFADFGTWLVSRLSDDLNNSGASARILNLEARPTRSPSTLSTCSLHHHQNHR